MRVVLATCILLLLAPSAAAAGLSLTVTPREGAIYGEEHRFSGRLTGGPRPLPGRIVVLRARPHPYSGAFTPVAETVTDADGRYSFLQELRRNHQVQVRAPAPPVTPPASAASSRVARAYVFPAARLSARTVRPNVVRITQELTVPRDVVLRAPSRFYLGRARAATATFVRTARPRRVRAGRFRVRVTVRVPAAYDGRFSYAACFRATKGAGLGDPKAGCPRRTFRF
jgi:hypothetical protein